MIYADDQRPLRFAGRNQCGAGSPLISFPSSFPSFPSSPSASLILALHDAGCVQFGELALASGRQSPVYLDLRRLAGDPALLRQRQGSLC